MIGRSTSSASWPSVAATRTRRAAGSRSRSPRGGASARSQFILTPLWGLAEADLQAGDASGAIARCEEGLVDRDADRRAGAVHPVRGHRRACTSLRPAGRTRRRRWRARSRDHLAGWDPVAGPALSHADGLVRARRRIAQRRARGAGARDPRLGGARADLGSHCWARLDLAHCLIRMNRTRRPRSPGQVRARAAAPSAVQPCSRAPMSSRGPAEGAAVEGAVAPADRPRVRGRAADRRGHDERRDRRALSVAPKTVARTSSTSSPSSVSRGGPRSRPGQPAFGGGAAASRRDRRHALRRLLPSSPPRSKVVGPTTRQRHGPGS